MSLETTILVSLSVGSFVCLWQRQYLMACAFMVPTVQWGIQHVRAVLSLKNQKKKTDQSHPNIKTTLKPSCLDQTFAPLDYLWSVKPVVSDAISQWLATSSPEKENPPSLSAADPINNKEEMKHDNEDIKDDDKAIKDDNEEFKDDDEAIKALFQPSTMQVTYDAKAHAKIMRRLKQHEEYTTKNNQPIVSMRRLAQAILECYNPYAKVPKKTSSHVYILPHEDEDVNTICSRCGKHHNEDIWGIETSCRRLHLPAVDTIERTFDPTDRSPIMTDLKNINQRQSDMHKRVREWQQEINDGLSQFKVDYPPHTFKMEELSNPANPKPEPVVVYSDPDGEFIVEMRPNAASGVSPVSKET